MCVTLQHPQMWSDCFEVSAIGSTGFRPRGQGRLPNQRVSPWMNGSFSRPRPGRSNNIFNIRSLKGADEEFLSLATNMFFSNDILVKNSKNIQCAFFTFGSCYMFFHDSGGCRKQEHYAAGLLAAGRKFWRLARSTASSAKRLWSWNIFSTRKKTAVFTCQSLASCHFPELQQWPSIDSMPKQNSFDSSHHPPPQWVPFHTSCCAERCGVDQASGLENSEHMKPPKHQPLSLLACGICNDFKGSPLCIKRLHKPANRIFRDL